MLLALVIALLFVLLIMGVPVGFAAGIAGAVGLYLIGGVGTMLSILETSPYRAASWHELMTIPMFLLMAEFVLASGLANGLAAIVGTIAMMIPPSVAMVLYAILTEQSVGKLLIAGVIPGVLIAITIILTALLLVWRDPSLAPAVESYPLLDKLKVLKTTGPVLVLFALVTGVIYTGVATPTEASALGAFGALLIAIARRRAFWRPLGEAFFRAASTRCLLRGLTIQRRPSEPLTKGTSDGPASAYPDPAVSGRGSDHSLLPHRRRLHPPQPAVG